MNFLEVLAVEHQLSIDVASSVLLGVLAGDGLLGHAGQDIGRTNLDEPLDALLIKEDILSFNPKVQKC